MNRVRVVHCSRSLSVLRSLAPALQVWYTLGHDAPSVTQVEWLIERQVSHVLRQRPTFEHTEPLALDMEIGNISVVAGQDANALLR